MGKTRQSPYKPKVVQDKKNPNLFKVYSTTRKGVYYNANLAEKTCSCPQFVFRGGKYGRECKHLAYLEENFRVAEEKTPEKPGRSKRLQVIKYLKEKGSEELIFLMEKFGDDIINSMLAENIIIEEHGKVRLL